MSRNSLNPSRPEPSEVNYEKTYAHVRMVSVLRVFSDGDVRTKREAHPLVAIGAGLQAEQMAELLRSG